MLDEPQPEGAVPVLNLWRDGWRAHLKETLESEWLRLVPVQ